MATGPLPFMFCPVGEPEPRLTTADGAPAPLLEAGMPDIPLLPRLMAVVEGLLETAMGFVVEPRATAGGWGRTTGIGWAILISGGLGTSGSLTSGSLIFGGSSLTTGGGGGSLILIF